MVEHALYEVEPFVLNHERANAPIIDNLFSAFPYNSERQLISNGIG
jgi:hypothetical protein